MLPHDCSLCANNPDLKKLWGCDWSKQEAEDKEVIPDDDGNAIEYKHCPRLWITHRIVYFFEKYNSIKSGFSSPVPFENEDAWFLDAKKYYEHWYNYCLRKKEKDVI